MKIIHVNRGEHCYEAQVDNEDYEFLSQYRWRASVRRTVTYANASVLTEAGYKSVEMHRMVIGDAEEDWTVNLGGSPLEVPRDNGKTVYILPQKYIRFRKKSVDHIDGNGLNNTRANLRHLSLLRNKLTIDDSINPTHLHSYLPRIVPTTSVKPNPSSDASCASQ